MIEQISHQLVTYALPQHYLSSRLATISAAGCETGLEAC